MIEVLLALLWIAIVFGAAAFGSMGERRARLLRVASRLDLRPPRSRWGADLDRPPSSWAGARALARAARDVQSRRDSSEPSTGLHRLGRVGSIVAISSALALVPFAGTWGGRSEGRAMVVFDLDNGLLALVLLILLSNLAQGAIGLSDRSFWSRLGAVRIVGSSLAAAGLFVLVIGALVLETGSLRLHDLVLIQRGTFAPAAWLGSVFGWSGAHAFELFRLPSWLLLTQPLTAILCVSALALLLRRPLALEAATGNVGVVGFGLDDDPSSERLARLERQLAIVLGASLFVVFFLGGGALPYVESADIAARLEPYAGEVVPGVLLVGIESGVFLLKIVAVFVVASRLRAALAVPRNDQKLRVTTQRLIPIAWANLLLMAALWQLTQSRGVEF